MQKVKAAMALLKSKSEKLGPAKIEGTDPVGGKAVPAVFFGTTKMNNNFTLVDEIVNSRWHRHDLRQERGRLCPRRDQCKEG
jgi:hypothetical protein